MFLKTNRTAQDSKEHTRSPQRHQPNLPQDSMSGAVQTLIKTYTILASRAWSKEAICLEPSIVLIYFASKEPDFLGGFK